VPQGRSSELRWSTLNATRVTLNGKSVASLDEINVSPQKTTRYVLVATNEAGVVERAETTVEVVRQPTIGYFNAEKATIYEGEETTLRWNTRDANRVRLDGKTVPLSGSKKVRPRATTTYSLIAEKGGLNVHESRQVTVKRRVQRTTSENFISSVTPQKLVESDAVKKAITIIIEGGDIKQAKRLMAKMAYSDGFTLNLDLSRFETAGGTIRQAQMIAAKLWKIGIKVDIRR